MTTPPTAANQPDHSPDHPGVITHPPFLYGGFALAGAIANLFARVHVIGEPAQYWAGGAAALAGVALMVAGVSRFRRAGTNVPTHKPATAIVTTGPYRFTRNPLYLALTLIYTGIALAIDNVIMLGLLAPLLLVMRYGVIGREEAYLERKFGEEYRTYKARVRRWI